MFVVALKKIDLEFEKSDVRRLALVFISRKTRKNYEKRVNVVMSRSIQRYDVKSDKKRIYFFVCENVAYRKRERCLYFSNMIVFECE